MLDLGCTTKENVREVLAKAPRFEQVRVVTEEARTGNVSVASFAVIARHFRNFTLA
jgi:hypothetical protein